MKSQKFLTSLKACSRPTKGLNWPNLLSLATQSRVEHFYKHFPETLVSVNTDWQFVVSKCEVEMSSQIIYPFHYLSTKAQIISVDEFSYTMVSSIFKSKTKLNEGPDLLVAKVLIRQACVHISPQGLATPGKYPPNFVSELKLLISVDDEAIESVTSKERNIVYTAPMIPNRGKKFFTHEIIAEAEDTDFVRNINYEAYFFYMQRAWDHFQNKCEGSQRARSESVQDIKTNVVKMTYLREVFAFDRIQVSLWTEELTSVGATFRVEFHKETASQIFLKVAVALWEVSWCETNIKSEQSSDCTWPEVILAGLLR